MCPNEKAEPIMFITGHDYEVLDTIRKAVDRIAHHLFWEQPPQKGIFKKTLVPCDPYRLGRA